jgi:hypothetical protein
MRRSLVLWVTVLCLLPRYADAKSLFGWLDALSGPGPFDGFEVSAEVWCFGVDRLDVLDANALNTLYHALNDERSHSLPPPNLNGARGTGAGDPDVAQRVAVLERRAAAVEERTAAVERRAAAVEALQEKGTVTPRPERFAGTTLRSCHARVAERAKQLTADESNNAGITDTMSTAPRSLTPYSPFQGETRYVRERRTFPIGVVLGYGDFASTENTLLDSNATRPDEPQVRARLYELTFNVKAHPAIDIGAGIGFSRFTPKDGLNGEITEFDTSKLHIIPASLVIRPARLITDDVLANAIGIQLTVRKLPALRASDFGVVSGPAPSSSYHVQGEFQWGWSVYFDLVSLAEHFQGR